MEAAQPEAPVPSAAEYPVDAALRPSAISRPPNAETSGRFWLRFQTELRTKLESDLTTPIYQ
jgi:hypothetical protein